MDWLCKCGAGSIPSVCSTVANRDLRFAGIAFPFGDCVQPPDRQPDQSVTDSAERSGSPKAFRPAENLAAHIGPPPFA